MKAETRYSLWLVFVYVLAAMALLLLLSACEKEPIVTPKGYRPVYPFEGTFEGNLVLHCDSIPYNKARRDQVAILCYDAEHLTVHNSLGTGYGYSGFDTYQARIEFTDQTDCGMDVVVLLQISGQLHGDSLIEHGTLVAKRYGKPYSGKYAFNGKRNKP